MSMKPVSCKIVLLAFILAGCGGGNDKQGQGANLPGGSDQHYSQASALDCLNFRGYATEDRDTLEAYDESGLTPVIPIGGAGEGFISVGLPLGTKRSSTAKYANTVDIGFERTSADARRSYRVLESTIKAAVGETEGIIGHKANILWSWDKTPTPEELKVFDCLDSG
jgi:hypothetical protein